MDCHGGGGLIEGGAISGRAGSRVKQFLSRNGWAIAFFALLFWLGWPRLWELVWGIEVTAAERGRQVAERSGCFTCHGPGGTGGVPNPGSEEGEVPGFTGGTPMMYANSEQELREYILDGAPARKRNDPHYRETVRRSLLAMPAYREVLSPREVDDLLAYLRAASGLLVPDDSLAAQGQELALRLGCFQCHGPMGARGPANPGSFKGYIPGWWGNDFRELVRDDGELREWIEEGSIARLRNHWLARRYIEGQRVSMPAYKNFLSDEEIRALMAYVRWVHKGEWQKQPLPLGH